MHAHPDDESITTGGTIAKYAAAGATVTVVTCTLGEEGEIIPPELAQLGAWAGDQLGGYRAGELAAAGAALGWTAHRYLGGIGRWRDSGMAGTASAAHPRAFVNGEREEQTEQLLTVLDELRPEVVITYDAFGGYGHPDHVRAHEITMAAASRASSVRRVLHTVASSDATARGLAELRRVGDLPWRVADDGELPVVADEHITTTVDIAESLPAKFAALRAHATQVEVREPAFALSNGIAQPVAASEYFVLAAGDGGTGNGADEDIFGGLTP